LAILIILAKVIVEIYCLDKKKIDKIEAASTAFMDSIQRMKSARESKKEKYFIKEQGIVPSKAQKMAKENIPVIPSYLKNSNFNKYLTKYVCMINLTFQAKRQTSY
jgi:hypothetical protein